MKTYNIKIDRTASAKRRGARLRLQEKLDALLAKLTDAADSLERAAGRFEMYAERMPDANVRKLMLSSADYNRERAQAARDAIAKAVQS